MGNTTLQLVGLKKCDKTTGYIAKYQPTTYIKGVGWVPINRAQKYNFKVITKPESTLWEMDFADFDVVSQSFIGDDGKEYTGVWLFVKDDANSNASEGVDLPPMPDMSGSVDDDDDLPF